MGRRNLETRLVESLLVDCLSVFAISNRCSKDSCCAHKGLVTNWPHHNIWRALQRLASVLNAIAIEPFATSVLTQCYPFVGSPHYH